MLLVFPTKYFLSHFPTTSHSLFWLRPRYLPPGLLQQPESVLLPPALLYSAKFLILQQESCHQNTNLIMVFPCRKAFNRFKMSQNKASVSLKRLSMPEWCGSCLPPSLIPSFSFSHLLVHSLLFLVCYCLSLPPIYVFYLLTPTYSSSLGLNASGKPFLIPQV